MSCSNIFSSRISKIASGITLTLITTIFLFCKASTMFKASIDVDIYLEEDEHI